MPLEAPQPLELSKNFPVLRVFFESSPKAVLLKKNGVIVLEETYMNDADGGFYLKFASLLHSLLKAELPGIGPLEEITTNYADFFLRVGYDEDFNFRVIRGGVNKQGFALISDYAKNFCKSRFLTWQPLEKEVTSLNKQYLTYYSTGSCLLKYMAYPDNIVKSIELFADTCYRIHVGSLDFDPATLTIMRIWVEHPDLSTTLVQQYSLIEPRSLTTDVFMFENSMGNIDTVEFTGTLTESDDHDVQKAVINDEMQEYDITYQRLFKKNTGYISTEVERAWLRDFFGSLQKWHYTGGQWRRIYLKSWDNESEAGELNSYTFSYLYSKEDGTNFIA